VFIVKVLKINNYDDILVSIVSFHTDKEGWKVIDPNEKLSLNTIFVINPKQNPGYKNIFKILFFYFLIN